MIPLWSWSFEEWFRGVPPWDAYGWLGIITTGAYWEIMGAIFNDRTTFTSLVRHTTPPWFRAIVILVLSWHFFIAKANFPAGMTWKTYWFGWLMKVLARL